jgi:HSP20 family protein
MTMMTRYDPFSNMISLRDAMNQLFQESFVAQSTNIMPVDIYETDDAFVVEAFMPGITPEQLSISVEQQTVTIHGEPEAEKQDGLRWVLHERTIGAFTRSFTLPAAIDAGKVRADLVNGVLSLTLPKSETAKPRKIQVKS